MIHSYKWICQIQCNPEKKEYGYLYKQPDVFPFFELKYNNDFYAIRYRQNNILVSETHYEDGDTYIGEVDCNVFVRFGPGIYNWNTLDDMYIGEWTIGACHGEGIYYWSHGCIYSGQWERQKFHGYGIHIFSDGSIFVGKFAYHKRVSGKMSWRDGSEYEGEWIDDSSGQEKDWDRFFTKKHLEQLAISKKIRK